MGGHDFIDITMSLHAISLLITACMAIRVGMERSKVEVQFTDINYEAEVLVGSAGLPLVSNSFKNLILVKQCIYGLMAAANYACLPLMPQVLTCVCMLL